jgi:replicative DNA helicase
MGEPIEGETHIHIAKNRSGSTATIKLQFIKEYQKFIDLPDTSFGNFKPLGDNPQAGIRRDTSGFGDSKLFIPGGFQTMPSKANKVNWDDEEGNSKPSTGKGLGGGFSIDPMDEEAPF